MIKLVLGMVSLNGFPQKRLPVTTLRIIVQKSPDPLPRPTLVLQIIAGWYEEGERPGGVEGDVGEVCRCVCAGTGVITARISRPGPVLRRPEFSFLPFTDFLTDLKQVTSGRQGPFWPSYVDLNPFSTTSLAA